MHKCYIFITMILTGYRITPCLGGGLAVRKIFSGTISLKKIVSKKIIRLLSVSICILMTAVMLMGCGKTSYLQETGSISGESTEVSESESDSAGSAKREKAGKTASESGDSISDSLEAAEHSTDSAGNDGIYVQVAGAVNSPGVFHLKADARVFEAIAMAGGMTQEADTASLNQAALLQDGQMIYVCKTGETPPENAAFLQSQASGSITNSGAGTNQTGKSSGTGSTGSGSNGSTVSTQSENGLVNINTADVSQLTTLPGIGETRAEAIIAYRQKNGAFKSCEDIMQVSGIKQGAYAKIQDKICVK